MELEAAESREKALLGYWRQLQVRPAFFAARVEQPAENWNRNRCSSKYIDTVLVIRLKPAFFESVCFALRLTD